MVKPEVLRPNKIVLTNRPGRVVQLDPSLETGAVGLEEASGCKLRWTQDVKVLRLLASELVCNTKKLEYRWLELDKLIAVGEPAGSLPLSGANRSSGSPTFTVLLKAMISLRSGLNLSILHHQ